MSLLSAGLFFALGCFTACFVIWYFHDRAKAQAIMKEAADTIEKQVESTPKQ